jgi:hypothetical protein
MARDHGRQWSPSLNVMSQKEAAERVREADDLYVFFNVLSYYSFFWCPLVEKFVIKVASTTK